MTAAPIPYTSLSVDDDCQRAYCQFIKETPEGELIWTGKMQGRHPYFQYGKWSKYGINARRYAFTSFWEASIPEGYDVYTTCSNPRCIHGPHLFLAPRGVGRTIWSMKRQGVLEESTSRGFWTQALHGRGGKHVWESLYEKAVAVKNRAVAAFNEVVTLIQESLKPAPKKTKPSNPSPPPVSLLPCAEEIARAIASFTPQFREAPA